MVKKKILKKSYRGKKNLTYRGTKAGIISNFSETMQAKREWSEIFKALGGGREEKNQPRILYPVKLPFRNVREIKTSSNKN